MVICMIFGTLASLSLFPVFAADTADNNGGEKVSEIAGAFEDWAGAATRLNRQTIDKYKQLDEYDTKIGETLQTMEDISGIDFDFENITPADAEALKEPFEQLCDYLNNE